MRSMLFDMVIVGSGFAGSLLALILKKQGFEVALIDRKHHPRFVIGESSSPTGNMILRYLCDRYDLPVLAPLCDYGSWLDDLPQLLHGRKRGFSYFKHEPNQPFVPTPRHGNELLVAASKDDYVADTQWYRADVDLYIFEQCRQAGVFCLEGTTILEAVQGTAWDLELQTERKKKRLGARFLVDASGSGQWLPRLLQLEPLTSQLNTHTRALYSHFNHVVRWPEMPFQDQKLSKDHPYTSDDAAVHHLLERAWMWQLRFRDGLLSAGIVMDMKHHPPSSRTPDEAWSSWLMRYPTLQDQFRGATLAPVPGRILETPRLQRLVHPASGRQWALLPHTAGFIDPLHSAGIALSLGGVMKMARLFEMTSRGSMPGPGQLETYSNNVLAEFTLMDRLVSGCYRCIDSFPHFTAQTMRYFAAATNYELRFMEDAPGSGLLFCADDTRFMAVLDEMHHTIIDSRESGQSISALEEKLLSLLAPYNHAGLFRPAVANMYARTAVVGN